MDRKDSGGGHADGVDGEGKKKKRRTLMFLFGGGKESSKDGMYCLLLHAIHEI
jgi:hypothetical protein